MDVKEQIWENIQNTENFAFYSSAAIQREKFKRFAEKFLNARSYGESERFARQLMNFVLYQHEKNVVVGPVLESLNNFELYGEYEYRRQRLHFTHLANVFLLGLYLYHNSSIIKRAVDREMKSTTSENDLEIGGEIYRWRYSSQSIYGEFLYRWRLTSLSHDLGYGISLSQNDVTRIREYLDEISTFLVPEIKTLEDLWYFKYRDLRDKLDSSIPEISLTDYMMHQSSNPRHSVYYDHGIISSLIFLRLMYEEYARHRRCPISYVGSTKVIWHESFLDTSILQSAIATALHNIEQHEEALREAATDIGIFNLERRSLSYLLKAADALQEWDKPPAREEILTEDLEPTRMQISFIHDKIVIQNFPREKVDGARRMFERFALPHDLIRFEKLSCLE